MCASSVGLLGTPAHQDLSGNLSISARISLTCSDSNYPPKSSYNLQKYIKSSYNLQKYIKSSYNLQKYIKSSYNLHKYIN